MKLFLGAAIIIAIIAASVITVWTGVHLVQTIAGSCP